MIKPWAIEASVAGAPETSWLWGGQTIEAMGSVAPSGATGKAISAGFVSPLLCETHTHGAMGLGVTEDEIELNSLLSLLQTRGIGSVQLSTVTLATEAAHRVLSAARELQRTRKDLIGIHLEGPFLSHEKKGAHDPSLLRKGKLSAVQELVEPYLDVVSAITIDPLRVGAEAISWLVSRGVTVAVGHTPATYAQALAAFEAGASVLTHAFNAMLPIGSREPGPVIAARDAGAWIEVIADGHHVHPALVQSLFDLAPGRIVLVTDSMSSAGLPDGDYLVGSVPVTMTGGIARTAEGNLAGSTVTLTEAVRNVFSWGVSAEEALLAATQNPRLAYGLAEHTLGPGQPADFLVWSKSMEPTHLVLNGVVSAFPR